MTARKVPLHPRKAPRQQRSRATCEAILEAAARILERGGGAALTTNLVADLAGVSIGSLYQYYPTKEAILAELIRQMRREMHEDMIAASTEAAGKGLTHEVDALIAATLRHHLRNPKLAQALEHFEDQLPLDAEVRQLKQNMARLVVGALSRYQIENPEDAAFDLVAIGHGMSHAAIAAGKQDLDDLHRRIRRAVLGYLRQPAQDPFDA